jgi:predicted enzyme related to lactoylglutathione lyase
MVQTPTVRAIYLFVGDLAKTIGFYQLLGFEVERIGPMFARTSGRNGVLIEFGTAELTKSYDPKWQPPGTPTKNTIGVEFGSGDAVDETYARMVQGGYVGHLAPCDPPWEARFAIIEDPDGNYIGLHGPRDRAADRSRERAVA